MTPEDAVRLLKPGVAIEYAPVLKADRGKIDFQWWTGTVESEPRRIGGGDSGVMVVNLCGMDPAYVWAATRGGRVPAADIEHVRLQSTPWPEDVAQDARDMLKWRDETIAVLVQTRKDVVAMRKFAHDAKDWCEDTNTLDNFAERARLIENNIKKVLP